MNAGHLPTTLVLMGGPDAEREISLMSGKEVAAALRESGEYRVIEQVIDAPTAAELRAIVDASGADSVFPVLHGKWGEGGPLQDLLEQIGIPYVGSPPQAAALAMDKVATKQLLARQGMPTPHAQRLGGQERCVIQPPLVLKPIDDGSSVDMCICRNAAEVEAGRAALRKRRPSVMAEEFIAGREVTVGIVLDEPLPLIQIVPAVEYYDFEAKYSRADTQYIVQPDLPEQLIEQCQELAMLAYRTVGCREVARVDFMLDERGPWFLEINTMPGFTTHSLVPMAAAAIGINMPELCRRLVQAARARRGGSAGVVEGRVEGRSDS